MAEIPERLLHILQDGEAAEARADRHGAEAAYKRATQEFGNYSSSWSYYGEFHRFWSHDLTAAAQAFNHALKAPLATNVSIAFAWRGLGEIARERGEIDQAIACLEKSLSIKPLVDAHRSLSALYATEKHDFELAAKHARAAIAACPDDAIALLQYAVQMSRLHKPHEANEAFARAIQIAQCDEEGRSPRPVHCCVLYNGACYHAVRGDKRRALAMLEEFFRTPNHRHITREDILRDPDFESLLNDSQFKVVLDSYLPQE
ncbi:MAG: tetratricopeptide repeat protein [Planctomycetes bacterium]|nr:tetratricopeptide repeat protein [Planctomycetota bacterium]